ncbi:MOSC domain-containing protein, partial [bacterium]
MSDIFLSEIYIYPIKSLGGIKLSASEFAERGLKFDRRWMLVNQDNKFISQREFPKMSLISTQVTEEYLICSAPECDDLKIPFISDGQSITVNVWRSYCQANLYEDKINNWFSNFLNSQVKLVYMPDSSRREVNPDYAVNDDIVSFADGYPFLLISQASLDDLNSKLQDKIGMDRFRPNLVISGSEAFSEHQYKS